MDTIIAPVLGLAFALAPILALALAGMALGLLWRLLRRFEHLIDRALFTLQRKLGLRRGEYCIVLRSSEADVMLSVNGMLSPDTPDALRIRDVSLFDLRQIDAFRKALARTLWPLPVVFVKNQRLMRGSLALEYGTSTWKEEVARDLDDASLVLIVPLWASPAVRWEIEYIRSKRLESKTFIVVPPIAFVRRIPTAEDNVALHDALERSKTVQPNGLATLLSEEESALIAKYDLIRECSVTTAWSDARATFADYDILLPRTLPFPGFIHLDAHLSRKREEIREPASVGSRPRDHNFVAWESANTRALAAIAKRAGAVESTDA